MASEQPSLFDRKKYTGVLPQTFQIAPPTSDCTVLKTLPAYHAYLDGGEYSKYTPDDFTSDVKKFGLFVKEKKLREIRTVDIQQWIGALKKVMTAKSVSRKISAITNYFLWLATEKVLSVNPAASIRYLRVTSPLPDILFESECRQLLTAASNDPRTYVLLLLFLETGIKKEELFDLKIIHFDLSNKYAPELWVKHSGKKVKKDRKLKLPPEMVPVFAEEKSDGRHFARYVCCSEFETGRGDRECAQKDRTERDDVGGCEGEVCEALYGRDIKITGFLFYLLGAFPKNSHIRDGIRFLAW